MRCEYRIYVITSCETHVNTWDEPVEVEVEGLPRAAINWQDDSALCQPASFSVELHARRVLNAAEVASLTTPYILDAESVQQQDVQVVTSCWSAEGVEEVLHEECRLLGPTRPTTTVAPPLLPGDPPDHFGVSQADHLVLPLQLGPLSLSETAGISGVDLEDAVRQLPHESGVQLVALGGDTCCKAAHQVPDIQANHKLSPLL